MTVSSVAPRLVVCLLFAAACGGASSRGTNSTPEIERLRQEARDNPNDAGIWTALAEAELLGRGDAAEARAAIDHALGLDPEAPALHFLSALEHDGRGKPAEALPAYLAAIEKARTSSADIAPTIAEVSLDAVHGLYTLVPNYDAQVSPVLRRITQHPGRLGLIAVEAAVQRLILAARRRGQPDDATASAAALGCLREWKAIGPFGPHPMHGFDERLAAEGAGALAGPYDLGEGIGEQAVFEGAEHDCRVRFEAPEHRAAGSTIAETFVEVEHAGPHLFVVDSGSSLKVSIDGVERLVVDRRRAAEAAYSYLPLELTAGRHEVEIKLTTRERIPSFSVTLDRPGRIEPSYDPRRGVDLPEPTSVLRTLLRARALHGRGGPVQAREVITRLEGEGLSARILVEQQSIFGDDPYLPDERREQMQRTLLQAAIQRDPQAFIPTFFLAAMQQGERESFEAMKAVAETWPQHPGVQRRWASILIDRGLVAQGEAVLHRVRERVPDDCVTVERIQEVMRSQRRVVEANALVDVLMNCNQSSSARFDLFARQRRWADARTELERVRPLWSESRVRRVELGLAQATGDLAVETRIREEMATESPDSEETALRRVDRALANGTRAEAIRLLDEAAEGDPATMHGLRRIRRDLTGRGEFTSYRVDGAEVIRDFEASGRTYTEPSVLVWDYMVTRVYPDGSARHLIHQIHKIQSEEAIERFGQRSFGGQLLVLRSIKPDGRQLEPERISGLDSIPMTDLEIGDYVEFELLSSVGPRANGSFRSNGWSFDNYDEPFDISKIMLVHPVGMTLTVESLGATPAPVSSERNGMRTVTWMMEQSQPPPNEPNAVPHPPFRSFLRFGFGATWDDHFLATYDALLDKDPVDPAVGRLVAEIVRGASTPREKVARLHRWVMENIEAAEAWLGHAPVMVHARKGNQTRVLRYMLELAGLPTQILLSRRAGEFAPSELSNDGLYTYPLLQVTVEGAQPLYATTGSRAPFGLLPPAVRGQDAVVLSRATPHVQIPDAGPSPDRHEVGVMLSYDGDAAQVEVRDEYHGMTGAYWRQQLQSVPAAELERILSEAYVSRVFPGAEVTELSVEGQDDWNGPLVFRYRARIAGYGRRRAERHFIPNVFPTALDRSSASLATRQTSQLVTGFAQKVVLRLNGIRSADSGAAVELNGPQGMVYRRVGNLRGDTLVVERTITIPQSIVTAAAYPRFAEFARAVSRTERAEIAFQR